MKRLCCGLAIGVVLWACSSAGTGVEKTEDLSVDGRKTLDVQVDVGPPLDARKRISDGGNRAETLLCQDKNGDGSLQTSDDLNKDGIVQPVEMIPASHDECMVFDVQPGGLNLGGNAINTVNNIWVADTGEQLLYEIEGESGVVIRTIELPLGPQGILTSHLASELWVVPVDACELLRITTESGAVETFAVPECTEGLYGIGWDYKGRVWLTESDGSGRIHRFDPENSTFANLSLPNASGYSRSIAGSQSGHQFVGHHTPRPPQLSVQPPDDFSRRMWPVSPWAWQLWSCPLVRVRSSLRFLRVGSFSGPGCGRSGGRESDGQPLPVFDVVPEYLG